MAKKNTITTEFTEIKVGLVKSKKAKKNGLLAMVSVTINNEYAIRSIQVRVALKGKNKGDIYVSFPQYKGSDDEWYNIFLPITAEAREELINAILEAYEEEADE
jgi:DNA-binding cell septation regulator SpoVG